MPEHDEAALHRAIAAISQSDPLIKLLQQVELRRIKPTDAGLRAVTESWLQTYQQVIESTPLNLASLRRLDPGPRLAVLINAGVLTPPDSAMQALEASFARRLADATSH